MRRSLVPEKRKFWQVLQGWLDATDPTRDVKLAAFSAVVVAGIWWLTKEQARGPIQPEWVDSFKWLLAATSIGGAVWTGVEKWRCGSPAGPSDGGGQ
jgi:hypothetical protein